MDAQPLRVYGYGASSDWAGGFGLFGAAVAALVLVAAWVILAGSRFVQGGVVERPERVPQLYGYTMCLVGLLWAIVSALSIVESVLTLGAPDIRAHTDFAFGQPSVTSFEAFRATYDRSRQIAWPGPGEARVDPIPEAELRRRYEALRADELRRVRVQAQRSIVTRTISLAIALGLFAFHWRWLRRRVEPASP